MKKKTIFFIIYLIFTMVSAFPASASADDVPKVNADIKVYDYAELLTEDQEKQLALKAKDILARHNIDIAIVTVNTTNGLSSMEYADDFYDYNPFGYGNDASGLLMLINMEEREVWISTTGNAITIFTDRNIDSLLDVVYTGLSQGDYYKAGNAFLSESERYISKWEFQQKPFREKYTVFHILFFSLFFGFGAGGFITFILFIFSKKSISGKPHMSTYQDNFELTTRRDNFLSTNTTRSAIPKNVSSSGSSRSGGSTTHTSSSGRTHGGGSRKF